LVESECDFVFFLTKKKICPFLAQDIYRIYIYVGHAEQF